MLKIIPKTKGQEEGVNLNSLKGGAIFLYQGILYIKDKAACAGTNLATGFFNEEIDSVSVTEVDATLTWQKKKSKAKKKK